MFKRILPIIGALALAGCATVEMSSSGAMENGDRLLVIQNNGYEIFWVLPLWSGELSWDASEGCVRRQPALFQNNTEPHRLYEMACKVAERENCDLVNVTFIDNYIALNLDNFYGAVKANDTAISAVLRPRARK